MREASPYEEPELQAQAAFVTKSLFNRGFSRESIGGGSGFMPEVFAFT
jgi:hypothetical protein